VVKEGGKKLSKRDGDAYYTDFVEKGYLPEAIVNFLAMLGWSPEDNKELFTLSELEESFTIERINNSPAVFDIKKLNWVNAQYIKNLSLEELKDLCMPHLVEEEIVFGKDESWINSLLSVFKDRLNYGAEIIDLYDEFFEQEFVLGEEESEFLNQEGVNETLKVFKELLEGLDVYNAEEIKPLIKETGKLAGSKGKMLFMPLRIATTASMHGPDLPQVLALLGKETVIERLNSLIK
jgi:glutamyl/glutaminyl-tRNA synthetase